jgi:hypothetical protein
MQMMKPRALMFAALLALAACDQAKAPEGQAAAAGGGIVLASTRNLPDWLLVARQRDCAVDAPAEDQCPLGEVHFNQRTITRTAGGFADIWVQASHGQAQLYAFETATTRTTIRFTLERLHYRFNCNTLEFALIERQIMGANETVVARDQPQQIYRAPLHRSITHIVMPIACRGS